MRRIRTLAGLSWMFMAQLAVAAPPLVPVSTPSATTGLWYNAAEPGWGLAITQHGATIFVAWYTYDAAGKPTWYAIPSCPIAGNKCQGDIARASGGQPLSQPWRGGVKLTSAGSATITFADNDHATLDFTLDGVAGHKAITRNVFSTAPAGFGVVDHTDLWFNAAEAGWGASITQQGNTGFLAFFTYDDAGKPTWYAVSNCAAGALGCTGNLFTVQGGVPPTADWSTAKPVTVGMGTASLAFTDAGIGLSATLTNGTWSRGLVRDAFTGDGLPDEPYKTVAAAWSGLLPTGAYRARGTGIAVAANVPVYLDCGTQPAFDPQALLSTRGVSITADTGNALCGRNTIEDTCFLNQGNVLVRDQTANFQWTFDIFMSGLVDGHLTHIGLDSHNTQGFKVFSRRYDPAIGPDTCSADGTSVFSRAAGIEGSWVGYRYKFDRTSRTGTLDAATMGCAGTTCTILGAQSVSLPFTTNIPLITPPYSFGPVQAAAMLSDDEKLASAWVCTVHAQLDVFRDCSFYTFRRAGS